MEIRLAVTDDLPEIEKTFQYAREFMKRTGNPTQWGDNRPAMSLVVNDIAKGNFYIVEENGELCGVFAFIIGVDPTYLVIENGAWLNDEPYGVIHRIAGNGKAKGMLSCVLDFCSQRIGNIRIDTHEDNRVMRHLLTSNGFTECGIIYVDNGTSRIAYHRKNDSRQ